MWKSVVGHDVNVKVESEGDDWETDPNFENDVSEQEQRWGSRTIEGSGRKEHISIADLRQNVSREHEVVKKKELDQGPKASYGYGGKFGVEKDRMDKGALGHGYVAEVEKHSSQTDAAKGFGGKFGVQKDRVDKSAMNYEYKGDVQQHASQKDYAAGFGGKYGVQKERVDKAAVGYDYKGETEKHQSQKDYAKGFGGKYGVEKEKVDKAALGYDYKGETEKHQSQKDYAKGFGGRYGVEADRMDKSAASFGDMESPSSSYEKPQAFEGSSVGAGNLKARFENMAKASDEEDRKKAEEERARRVAREKREREEAQRKQEEQSKCEEEEENQRPPPPVPASQNPPETFRKLPEIPRDEPEEVAQVDPDYEEPPLLPPRSADLMEEEEEEEQTYSECDPPPVPQEEDYEDIGSCTAAAVDNDYEDLSGGGHTATAVYDYQGEASDEISFMPGDVITNIEMIDEGWWKGTCHGRTGLFPATFVELQ
ncbi:src substrate protein p85-like isoform X4 [Puntigrus tetrazona]|uniref:src substrate protein p85-like isoform X3 n=1 Tax=Puntigrus tetrazona TaxID=1606681 RepID=UPI001C8A5706|nr:src substrate protein p85-like isoform X3 [Puntigrus tetrazona]XP_043093574.1 src substrate protein p85-like isoform X4 [Puntigrus tetrazona]